MGTQGTPLYDFGSFRLDRDNRQLLRDGQPVPLTPKVFDTLLLLVENSGRLVLKDELLKALWPDTFVAESSLTQAVFTLRKALGESGTEQHYIATVPRRGYRFATDVRQVPRERSRATEHHSIGDRVPDVVATTAKLPLSRSWRALAATIAVLLTIAAAGVFYASRSRSQPRASKGTMQPAIRSVAVLPLKNLSGDPTQEYFADGMTEALIGRLSMIRSLRVISRTSVMRFKDTRMSAPEIAKSLQVDTIVEGSVIREGSRVRIHAQLIRGATDEHFWSEAYDRELRDVLALESEVAQSIARKVEVSVTGKERGRVTAGRSVSPEVYESYLKGRFTLDKSKSRTEVEKSIAHFEEAIRKDSTFAPAYVDLAGAYIHLSSIFVGGASPDEARPKAISALQKALELDADVPHAHALLADIYKKWWQWSDAEAEYKRALELNPNDAAAHHGLAMWLMCQGRMEEALAWSRRARELDPIGVHGTSIGWILFNARRYDEAIRELRSVLAAQAEEPIALWYLGFALIANGQSGEAIPVIEKTVSLMERSPGSIELLATAYAHAGRRTQAYRLLNELKQRRQISYVPPGAFINPYLALGEYDEAFAWFERAYQEKSSILQFLKVHPFFDSVREDARFKGLVHRVGLT